jgi:hypothetical protein
MLQNVQRENCSLNMEIHQTLKHISFWKIMVSSMTISEKSIRKWTTITNLEDFNFFLEELFLQLLLLSYFQYLQGVEQYTSSPLSVHLGHNFARNPTKDMKVLWSWEFTFQDL